MNHIADYVINDGYINITELNEIDTNWWRKAVKTFGAPSLKTELVTLSEFLLKAA